MQREKCPCCGFPTLGERGVAEICRLCDWEDDGQDDPHADEIWGGPNGDYSLTEARKNYKENLIMYRDRERIYRQTNKDIETKKFLMSTFIALETCEPDSLEYEELWRKIKSLEENDSLLEGKYEQIYRKPTTEEHEQILHILKGLRSEHLKEQRTEIVAELNELISYIDETDIRVEDKGTDKHVSIYRKTVNEHLILDNLLVFILTAE